MRDKIRTLWTMMAGQRLRYGAAILAILLSIVLGFLPPLIAHRTIDHVIDDKPVESPTWLADVVDALGGRQTLQQNIWALALAMIAFAVFSQFFAYLKGRFSAQA